MEKLQPFIKQRFWILSGLVAVLSLLGWYLGSNDLAAFTKKQNEKIKSADSGIPEGDIHPNDKWIVGLKDVNSGRKTRSNMSAAELFAEQVGVMDWPPTIAANFDGVGYREPAKSIKNQDKEDVRKYYRDFYQTDVIQPLEQIVVPYNPDTKEGIVKFDVGLLNYFENWSTYTPEWSEMWDMQEDFWLTRSLLESIARVNRGEKSTTYGDASIQEILSLHLYAGSEPNPGDYSGITPPGIKTRGGKTAGGKKERQGPMGFGKKSKNQNKKSAKASQKNAETVPVRTRIGITGVTAFGIPVSGEAPPESDADDPIGGSGGDDEGDAPVEEVVPRYVEEDPELPFKTRGFIIVLDMKLESLPLLLKELNQLEWPVEIRRVHWRLQKANVEAGFTDTTEFSEIKEKRKDTKKMGQGTRGTGSAGTGGAPQGGKKTRGSGSGQGGQKSKAGDPNRITTVTSGEDRRSDVEVHIAGVMTIYRPPTEDSGIKIPTLQARRKPTQSPTPKPETKPEIPEKRMIPIPTKDAEIPRKSKKNSKK